MNLEKDLEKLEEKLEEIENPKMDMVYTGLGVVLLAIASLYLFRVVAPQPLPEFLILPVPFSAQAPTNNWSRNEDCEETSITMANAFLTNTTQDKLPAGAAQEAINNLKKWEEANLGYNANTGVGATIKMGEGAFGLKIEPRYNFTEEELKKELVKGHPILLPINARLLGSPQYKDSGPTYHMVVVRGFKGQIFIVNDPGTNNGDGNEYTFRVLKNAAADWNQTTMKMDPTRKIALIVSR